MDGRAEIEPVRALRRAVAVTAVAIVLIVQIVLVGCATPRHDDVSHDRPEPMDVPAERPVPNEDTRSDAPVPDALLFVTAHVNERSAPYYPLEGLAGLAFHDDGTLYVCDETAGRIHGWASFENRWFAFDTPGGRFFRPVDVAVDGFHVLVLDEDARELQRFDMAGVFLDRLVDFRYLDPGYDRVPTALDVDVDGGVVVCDGREGQVLQLDSYLSLRHVVGMPGSHREQFREPDGVVIQRDGSFVVSDRGNRRLQRFNRMGSFTDATDGTLDLDNVMLTPQGIDRDGYDNLFVADPAAGALHVFDPDLRHLFSVSHEMGLQAALESPVDVAVGPDGLVAVADRGRQAVVVYRILYR